MLVLYKYKLKNKKGQFNGKYLKQVYSVDIYGDEIKIGGTGELGRNLYFWPEGDLSNCVMTDKTISQVTIGHEIETEDFTIYKIM